MADQGLMLGGMASEAMIFTTILHQLQRKARSVVLDVLPKELANTSP